MPFDRPTLTKLNERILTTITSRLPGVKAGLRRSNVKALAGAQAGYAHGIYGHQNYIADQMLPGTADAEHLPRHAAMRQMTLKTGNNASGDVNFTSTQNATLKARTVLIRDDGTEFRVDADTVVNGETAVSMTAVVPGAASNTAAGAALSFVSPLGDIDSTATVGVAGIIGGTDPETTEQLRSRVLKRWRAPPQGGAAHDYEAWALDVDGVTRAWVSAREMGLGTVTVRYVMDNAADIFPDVTHLQLVFDYINARRPVTGDLYVVAPVPTALDMTLQLNPLNEATRAAVIAEIEDLFFRTAKPGATVRLSHLREAVSIAAGETDNAVTVPATDMAHGPGQFPVPGVLTWEVKA